MHTIRFLLSIAGILGILLTPVRGQDPNILLIMTDQQAWDAVGYAGNDQILTPNLDRLAREGVNFSQAVTPCPVCVPARTSILTGHLTEKTTIRSNRDARTNDCFYPTFDEILAKKGYRTEYYGKFHAPAHMAEVYMNPPVEGLDKSEAILRWEPLYVEFIRETFGKRPLKKGELYERTFYGGTIPYRPDPPDRFYKYLDSGIIPEEESQKRLSQADVHGVLDLPAEYTITAIQAKQCIDALERLKDETFILTCSFHCPHVPITPSEPYASMYDATKMKIPASIIDTRENSPYSTGREIPPYNDPEKVGYMVANYYAFVTEIDDWVGRILTRLEELELEENTLVIFVSDHGEMLGAHGMRGKFNFYEESVRVPFLIRYPGAVGAGQTISTPVSILNIFPTILDYAGVKNIVSDGYSLKGVMEGTEDPEFDFAVSEWDWENERIPSVMIRTEEWKLMTTHRPGGRQVEVLFNLQEDPTEMNNLLGTNTPDKEYRNKAEELRSLLVSYLRDKGHPLAENIENRRLFTGIE
jgi:arylsulfatase A-like enzyme